MGEPVMPPMTSQRPYLLRALYEWIVDNGMTPHILVNAAVPGVRVPAHTVKDGQVVLNIADRAVGHLQMGNDAITFSARFGGVSQSVRVPLEAVIAVYARETGQGMALPMDQHPAAEEAAEAVLEDTSDNAASTKPQDGPQPPTPPKRGNHLRVIK